MEAVVKHSTQKISSLEYQDRLGQIDTAISNVSREIHSKPLSPVASARKAVANLLSSLRLGQLAAWVTPASSAGALFEEKLRAIASDGIDLYYEDLNEKVAHMHSSLELDANDAKAMEKALKSFARSVDIEPTWSATI